MILTSLDEVRPGMMLGAGVHNVEGQTLLGPDVPLTAGYIARLEALGCTTVWVDDEDTRDIPFDHLLSEETRLTACTQMRRIFALAAREAPVMHAASIQTIRATLDSRRFQRLVDDEPAVERLTELVDTIAREVADRQTLPGLGTLRNQDTVALHHGVDVAAAAAVMGRLLGYDRHTLKKLIAGCLLHDVGKAFIEAMRPIGPARLDPDGVARLREHPGLGYLMLRETSHLGLQAAHVAYQHHERQDGGGYPRGLIGTNRVARGAELHKPGHITPLAEICAIADYYDAQSTERPYRRALPHDQVWHAIRQEAGTRFNREIAELFLSIVPPYPLGTRVAVLAGPWQGHTGVVARLDRQALGRPLIRVLADESGRRVPPVDLDLGRVETAIAGLGSRTQAAEARATA